MSALKQAITSDPVIVGSLLIGADAAVAEIVRQLIPNAREHGFGPCTAIGIVRNGRLIGGVVFNYFRGFDVHMTAAFDGKGWFDRRTIRALCDYTFNQLGCKRVTALTGKKNKKARSALERIGFKLEGVHPRGLDGREDAMSFGLLKENCKWITKHEHSRSSGDA
jgi:RimJ/RimL family protein N-acetyltransferase